MEINTNDRNYDFNDPKFLKNTVIFRLKSMCDHLIGGRSMYCLRSDSFIRAAN